MKRLMVALIAALMGLAMLSFDAEAKRLGGGSSFGMQRAMPRSPAPAPAVAPKPAPTATPQAPTPPAPQPAGASRWLGPLAGLAAGIGLAALFSHFGIGEGLGSILMLAALVFGAIFLVRLLFGRRQPAPEYAGAGTPARFEPTSVAGSGAAASAGIDVPPDFDVAGFLRNAKLSFVRLQAANDTGDIEDIRQFTTPEAFAEIKLQFDERGRAAQQTDVVQLDADLLGLETEENRHIASVRFHGLIREEANAAPAPFDEVWHVVKPVNGSSGWQVAGIQQVQ